MPADHEDNPHSHAGYRVSQVAVSSKRTQEKIAFTPPPKHKLNPRTIEHSIGIFHDAKTKHKVAHYCMYCSVCYCILPQHENPVIHIPCRSLRTS